MKKIQVLLFWLLLAYLGNSQNTDFIIASSSQSNNQSAFTVGDIFIMSGSNTGFLAAHVSRNIDLSTEESSGHTTNKVLTVFPIPSSGVIHLEVNKGELLNEILKIYSSSGTLVLEQSIIDNTVSLESLESGSYIVHVDGYKKVKLILL